MSTGFGQQVDQAQRLQGRLTSASQQLDASRAAITVAVNSAWWAGPQADRFRSAWQSSLGPSLRTASSSLSSLASLMERERAQQIQASQSAGLSLPAVSVGGSRTSLLDMIRSLKGIGDRVKNWAAHFKDALDVVGAVGEWLKRKYLVAVRGYWRAGKWVNEHFRWSRDAPQWVRDVFRKAGQYDDLLKKIAKVPGPLGWAIYAWEAVSRLYDGVSFQDVKELASLGLYAALGAGAVFLGATVGVPALIGGGVVAVAGMALGLVGFQPDKLIDYGINAVKATKRKYDETVQNLKYEAGRVTNWLMRRPRLGW
jgi:hypothetical protein